jgi:hypothetical protein
LCSLGEILDDLVNMELLNERWIKRKDNFRWNIRL